jgi:hypothetical protein
VSGLVSGRDDGVRAVVYDNVGGGGSMTERPESGAGGRLAPGPCGMIERRDRASGVRSG